MSLCVVVGWSVLGASAVVADICPNEHIRLQEGIDAALPDCRAYEQASPVEKNLTDVLGTVDLTQASPSGDKVTFISVGPLAGIPGGSELPTYLGSRRADSSEEGEWTAQGLLPPTETGAVTHVYALTEDLADAFMLVSGGSEASPSKLFKSDDSLFIPGPPMEVFSGASADDSRIFFESTSELLSGAEAGVPNLYEWEGGKLSLVGVLPDGKIPVGGAVAGPGGQPNLRGQFYTQGAISEDGSRVFFTAPATGQIYMHEPLAGRTVEVSAGRAEWRAATPDGSDVFYTEGGELYRFNVGSRARKQLTQSAGTKSAEVQGTLGISSDGSYVYFVAKGVLSGAGAEGRQPVPGAENVYEWHEGASTPIITYIADLRSGEAGDESDWRGYHDEYSSPAEAAYGEKSSRVTPNGLAVLFSSIESLTGYDNNERYEFYLYNALTARIVCVSCNPNGRAATTGAYLARKGRKGAGLYPTARAPFLTRNLSSDGGRVFFQTEEALVAKDSNGLNDVYEWESGHLYLISSGQGDAEAYFGDASANGDDVFFFTSQPLVSGDRDDNTDLYDARVDGGIAAQNKVLTPPCVGEECHGAIAPAPVFEAPASATYSGAGNLAPEPEPVQAGGGAHKSQKLVEALRACGKKTSSRRRAACRTRAEKLYAGKAAVEKTSKRRWDLPPG